MILSTQRLPPIKNNINIKSNISSIETPNNIFFPDISKLKQFKNKISLIKSIPENMNLRINTSPNNKSINESKLKKIKKERYFFLQLVYIKN